MAAGQWSQGSTRDADLHTFAVVGRREGAQQSPARCVLCLGQFAHIHASHGGANVDVQGRITFDGNHLRLVSDAGRSHHGEHKIFGLGIGQTLLEIDCQSHGSVCGLGQQDRPQVLAVCDDVRKLLQLDIVQPADRERSRGRVRQFQLQSIGMCSFDYEHDFAMGDQHAILDLKERIVARRDPRLRSAGQETWPGNLSPVTW